MKIVLLLLMSALLFSCQDDSDSIETLQGNMLIGSWINPTSTDIDFEIKYKKSDSLKENQYGISFLVENIFIEKSSGWCGTPPLVFHDYQGTWSVKDSIIGISIDSRNFQWKIKSLDRKYLILERVN